MQRIPDESRIHQITKFSEKPQLGVPYGKFRITIRLAGQRNHTELEGEVSDCTSMFVNPLLVADFKAYVSNEIAFTHQEVKKIIDVTPIREESIADQEQTNNIELPNPYTSIAVSPTFFEKKSLNSSLDDAIKAFREYPLSKVCRVLLLTQGFNSSEKHIILQFGRLNPLLDYASVPDDMSRSFIGGQRGVECVVAGQGLSLPTRVELPDGLGEGYVHWLIPDDPVWDSEINVATLNAAQILCEIVPWVHHDVETAKIIESLEDIIKSKEEAKDEMGNQVKASAIELDTNDHMVAGLRRHSNKSLDKPKKNDFIDFAILGGCTLFFGFLGGQIASDGGWFAGIAGGLMIGFGLVSWRR